MARSFWKLLAIGVLAAMAAFAVWVPGPARADPFGDGCWTVESVMVVGPATTTYRFTPPRRVVRDGRVTFEQRSDVPLEPVIRIDLRVDGEAVTVYTGLRN
jgi:hypothetical protein